jgi:TfoX/Sxy family transcriptional regulator of competence genes
MPKSSPEAVAFFQEVVPMDEPGVETRKMFGYPSAFVNGNLFMGLFGDGLMLRLSEADRAGLLKIDGAEPFEPMPGHAMKEYVLVPDSFHGDRETLDGWIEKSLAFVGGKPAKEKKPPKAKKRL